jgi:hypothetical protein
MKRLLQCGLLAASNLLASAPAMAAVPVFSATCPTGIDVDADRTGSVRINGKKASLKKSNPNYYEARGSGVIISIAVEANGPPLVSYTGKHGANGICQVTASQAGGSGASGARPSASERAGQGVFDARGQIPCAQHQGQPMGQCEYGVARENGGTASVAVTLPDGRKRFIFFQKGKATSADLSQADGNMTFRATKEADLFKVQAGDERYEIPEAVVFGG